MAIIMFPSCSDEHEAVILEITNNEIILQAEGDPVQVEVKSNTEWRIDFVESTWFSTDIRGAQSSRTYFTVTYDENISDSERFCDIRVFTKDGKTADVIKIKQLSVIHLLFLPVIRWSCLLKEVNMKWKSLPMCPKRISLLRQR